MERFTADDCVGRSRPLDLNGIAWDDVPRHPLPPEALRTLRYMQDIESHTIVYLRTLLSTRAVDDPDVAAFLACWLYEESAHGRALARMGSGDQPAPRVVISPDPESDVEPEPVPPPRFPLSVDEEEAQEDSGEAEVPAEPAPDPPAEQSPPA